MNGTPYTPSEERIIRERYANERTDDIASYIGKSIKSVYHKAHCMGLKKSQEFIRSGKCGCFVKGGSYGVEHRFKKGNVPFNAGLKGLYKTTNSGQFPKGNLPPNTKFDGCITTRKDKSGHDYKFIRIGKAKWELYHRYLWVSVHGPIPKGMIIIFRDGNSLNAELDNLMMISRSEHAVRNHNQPKAIAKIKQNFIDDPNRWYTVTRLSRIFNVEPELIFGELRDSLIAAAKLKKTLRYATHRNARNTEAA